MRLLWFFLPLFIFLIACSDDDEDTSPAPDEDIVDFVILSGPTVTFTKADGADPSVAENQDRITDNVWITRGIEGGQIYNARSENEAVSETSPADTEWAVGNTGNIANLTFAPFRTAVERPQDVVGIPLVLHLITDEVYLDVTFTSWSAGRDAQGGFSYERSSDDR